MSPAHFLTLDRYRSWAGPASTILSADPIVRCSLQSVPVLFCVRSKADSDVSAEDRLPDGGAEGDQQLFRQVKLPELS